jgi:hypothetical protein
MKILVVGINCQVAIIKDILNVLLFTDKVDSLVFKDGIEAPDLNKYDKIFLQNIKGEKFNKLKEMSNVFLFPNILFAGFQPDYVYLDKFSSPVKLANHSNLIFMSYAACLPEADVARLFHTQFLQDLGYREQYIEARKWLIENLDKCHMDGDFYFQKWSVNAPFMYTINHPKIFVFEDIARHLCNVSHIKIKNPLCASEFFNDPLRAHAIFPSFNAFETDSNRLDSMSQVYKCGKYSFTLKEFISHRYRIFDNCFDDLVVDEVKLSEFKNALYLFNKRLEVDKVYSRNPYRTKSKKCMWRKSVSGINPLYLAPLKDVNPIIDETTKVATAGSCFAQHIARTLVKNALNYYVAEKPPTAMSKQQSEELGYDLFSARFGNVYTARQLLQLIKRAYGMFEPEEYVWLSKSGNYIDPFRPNIGEEFISDNDVITQRKSHLLAVREMFENLDVFVFTLGLTESWLNTHDGAVYPVAPGVVSQHANYANYSFKNYTHEETREDMIEFFGLLRSVNRQAKVLLTVSPVPLIATYEDEHVLSATTYSKSVLRAVAGELTNAFSFVSYFPSYEIITGSFNKGAYYESDLRSVKPEGVAHVMGVFMDYMVAGKDGVKKPATDQQHNVDSNLLAEIERNADIVCDEELIEEN